ncbi:MAG: cupin domain-containing protein [Planctomycetota bacterium]
MASWRATLVGAGSSAVALAIGVVLAGCEAKAPAKPSIEFRNADFYDADGKFLVDKARDAYITLMRYHGYSLADKAEENKNDKDKQIWVSDYGTGQFTKIGLAAWMFMNNEEDRYMQMDLYLLPGQMLPEHWHLKGDINPAKREGWLIRHGLSHVVGEGEPNLGPDVKVPACHMDGKVTVEHEIVAKPGDFVPLVRVESRHWQLGGPEGAIITEVANVHTGPAVRHSDQAINDQFLGK